MRQVLRLFADGATIFSSLLVAPFWFNMEVEADERSCADCCCVYGKIGAGRILSSMRFLLEPLL